MRCQSVVRVGGDLLGGLRCLRGRFGPQVIGRPVEASGLQPPGRGIQRRAGGVRRRRRGSGRKDGRQRDGRGTAP